MLLLCPLGSARNSHTLSAHAAELASMVRLSEQASSDRPAAAVAAAVVADELQYAEELASASRASLADAQAALRHATEAVRAHTGLEMVGEVG